MSNKQKKNKKGRDPPGPLTDEKLLQGADIRAPDRKIDKKTYEAELERLQIELVKLTAWIKETGQRVIVIFEGRDAAGKGGTIKRIREFVSPRTMRVVALPAPNDRERTQWYFQRYVAHLPAAGEIVLFDRSWYNRAGVEKVMEFCTQQEYEEFLRVCPLFERMITRSGIQIIKYWFSVSQDVQERRFQARIETPLKQWKLSPMDLESRNRWVDYSRAKDVMTQYTDTKWAPWWIVNSDNKRRARLNCIHHLISLFDYEDVIDPVKELPKRKRQAGYVRPPLEELSFVPEVY